jgi:hypothetical protein
MCHYDANVIATIVTSAQDRGMTEGDYAWFIYTDFATQAFLQPWTATSVYNTSNSSSRLNALYSVNLVRQVFQDD